jgi:protein TonB
MSLTFRNGGLRIVRPVSQPQVSAVPVFERQPTPIPEEPVFVPIEPAPAVESVPEPVPEPVVEQAPVEPEPVPEPEVTVPTTENDA